MKTASDSYEPQKNETVPVPCGEYHLHFNIKYEHVIQIMVMKPLVILYFDESNVDDVYYIWIHVFI